MSGSCQHMSFFSSIFLSDLSQTPPPLSLSPLSPPPSVSLHCRPSPSLTFFFSFLLLPFKYFFLTTRDPPQSSFFLVTCTPSLLFIRFSRFLFVNADFPSLFFLNVHLGSCPLGNCTFGKLPLGKLTLGKLTYRKRPLGKPNTAFNLYRN